MRDEVLQREFYGQQGLFFKGGASSAELIGGNDTTAGCGSQCVGDRRRQYIGVFKKWLLLMICLGNDENMYFCR